MENFEDIKEGGIYDVRIVVEQKRDHALLACALSDAGAENKPRFVFHKRTVSDFCQVTPENGIKNTEGAPKYDPCRKFREGDIVRLIEWNGRKLWDDIKHLHRIYNEKGTFTVHDDEQGNDVVIVPDAYTENVYCACPACLELVTPVEELEPYSIGKSDYNGFVNIEKKGKIIAMIPYGKELHEHKTEEEALAAAEAERDRLNAEYRKEQQ
jgi:hypothetical protein